jgi:hypothetical protein
MKGYCAERRDNHFDRELEEYLAKDDEIEVDATCENCRYATILNDFSVICPKCEECGDICEYWRELVD